MMTAEVVYPSVDEGVVEIKRVYVSPILRGQGVAHEMMLEAYKTIKDKKLKVIPSCKYASVWFKRHPEYQDILND